MEYLQELAHAIKQIHGCNAVHQGRVSIKEVFQGQVVWDGDVEIFKVTDHPKATKCYAWGHPVEKSPRQITAVLQIPPVVSPETAVKAAIVAKIRST